MSSNSFIYFETAVVEGLINSFLASVQWPPIISIWHILIPFLISIKSFFRNNKNKIHVLYSHSLIIHWKVYLLKVTTSFVLWIELHSADNTFFLIFFAVENPCSSFFQVCFLKYQSLAVYCRSLVKMKRGRI